MSDTYSDGRRAYEEGFSNLTNPHEPASEDYIEWNRGWLEAQIDNGRNGVGA